MKLNRILILTSIVLAFISLIVVTNSGRILGLATNENVRVRYFDFRQSAFDSSPARLRTVCFLASWDEYCKKADENILSSQGSIPDDQVIFKADFDSQVELKKKYGLNIKHECVVIDKSGEVIKRTAPENILKSLKYL